MVCIYKGGYINQKFPAFNHLKLKMIVMCKMIKLMGELMEDRMNVIKVPKCCLKINISLYHLIFILDAITKITKNVSNIKIFV